MDVIQAKSDIALKSSVEQLKGSVLRVIREIRAKLLHHIAYIETALDDPEHFDLEGYPDELMEVVKEEAEEVKKLLKSADDGKMIQEGIRTVILGKPNAGKSSLFKFSCRRGSGNCNRNCRNHKRYAGGIYFSSWNQFKDH